jgi:tRNA (guanine-N7-)-methyltransferase
MRLRNVPGAREAMVESEYTVNEPKEYKGRWNELFGNDNPIRIEVGMGKGRFIMQLAAENPDANYVGIEKYSSVLIRALEKQEEAKLPNIIFIRMDAEEITDVFGAGEVDRIYLNFSDPWPKDRHAKRRLTSSQFLARYDKILAKDGHIQFKTDNRPLFDFSLEEINDAGWTIDMYDFNLHKNGPAKDNIMTEYEEKFFNQGKPICKLICHR